jgi:hypothetical protein
MANTSRTRYLSALALGMALALLRPVGAVAQQPKITVMVFNRTHATSDTLRQAQQVAQQALQQIGVESVWVTCFDGGRPTGDCADQPSGVHLVLSLVSRWNGRETDSSSLGLALTSENSVGGYCYLFVSRLDDLVAHSHVSPSRLLAYAMAHELGHLLKGSNSHTPNGIMAAWWTPAEMQRAGMGALDFTAADREVVQKRLLQYGGASPQDTINLSAAEGQQSARQHAGALTSATNLTGENSRR